MELLRSFTADYVRQTSLLLGEPAAEGVQGDLLTSFENAAAQLMLPLSDLAPHLEEKKERKKRTHDPNAPKRPLTPYFLYMQHARSIIANDLGADAPKGAVQEEGQRRWAQMSPTEKKVSDGKALEALWSSSSSSSLSGTTDQDCFSLLHRDGTRPISTTCVSTTPASTRTSQATPWPRT